MNHPAHKQKAPKRPAVAKEHWFFTCMHTCMRNKTGIQKLHSTGLRLCCHWATESDSDAFSGLHDGPEKPDQKVLGALPGHV